MKREWMGAARLGVVLFLLYLAIHYWGALSSLLLLGLGAASPLVLGAVIAYAVNILMSLYEGWYFPDTKSPFVIKSRRPVCLLLAFASLIAIVFLLIQLRPAVWAKVHKSVIDTLATAGAVWNFVLKLTVFQEIKRFTFP